MTKKYFALFLSVLLVIVWASTVNATRRFTLMLDWFPNVDHLPIYVAQQRGFLSD